MQRSIEMKIARKMKIMPYRTFFFFIIIKRQLYSQATL